MRNKRVLYWLSTVAAAVSFPVAMLTISAAIGAVTGAFANGVTGYLSDPAVIKCTLVSIPLLTGWLSFTDRFTARIIKQLPLPEMSKDGVGVMISMLAVGVIFFLPAAKSGATAITATMATAAICGFAAGLVRGAVWLRGGGEYGRCDPDIFA